MQYDWPALIAELNQYLKLKATPVGLKLFKDRDEINAIPKLRRPPEGQVFSACQLLGQAVRLNFTVGITAEDLSSYQCRGMLGLCGYDKFEHSEHLKGVWYASSEAALKHQAEMFHLSETYEAAVISPLSSGRLAEPDVCIVYGTPQQCMLLCNALQYENYEVVQGRFVGESSCSDSWVRAIVTDKPCITIPCYAERRYGGVTDEEMIVAFPPRYMPTIVEGLKKLSRNGLRYPASFYGIQHDINGGLGKSYDTKTLK